MPADGRGGRSPFPSFFMGGFECSTAILPDGRRLDVIAASQHDAQVASDYRLLREAGLLTVREAVRWPLAERGGDVDLSSLVPMVRALREEGLTAIWDLFHYGYPEDVDLFSHEFPARFAAYCGRVAAFLARELPPPRFYTPINEISYFSYAAGEAGLFAPFARGRGTELKRQLVRAALSAFTAIRRADSSARFVQVDPLIHLVPPCDGPDLAPAVVRFNREVVFQTWLMLSGRAEPELGGSEEALDIVGLNLYRLCQWEYERPGRFLEPSDARWTPVREMLRDAWERLGHPLIIAETGENGPRRPGWLRYLVEEVQAAREMGVPIWGLCWYPAVSCPDWHDPTSIFPAGLWDVVPVGSALERVPVDPLLGELQAARRGLAEPEGPGTTAVLPSSSLKAPCPATGVTDLRPANARRCREMAEGFGWELLAAGERTATTCYTFRPGQCVSVREYAGVETVVCVLEGDALLFDWNRSLPLTVGDVIVIPEGSPFGLGNAGSVTCRILQVCTPRPWSGDTRGPAGVI